MNLLGLNYGLAMERSQCPLLYEACRAVDAGCAQRINTLQVSYTHRRPNKITIINPCTKNTVLILFARKL